jgi:hypothetical protein
MLKLSCLRSDVRCVVCIRQATHPARGRAWRSESAFDVSLVGTSRCCATRCGGPPVDSR